MSLLWRQKTLAVKVESVKGTAETLSSADVVVQAIDPTCSLSPAELERLIQASDLDRYPSIIGAPEMTMSFGVEIRGSGTAGTAPGWFRCLQGCGNVVTDATNEVTVDPESNDDLTDTLTLATIIGDDTNGLWVEMKGARGNMTISGVVNQIARADFTFTGVLSQVQNSSPPSSNYESTLPIPWHNAQISIDGSSFATGNYGNFTFDLGNEVYLQEDANDVDDGVSYAVIANRNPRGTIDPRIVALSTYNPWTTMTASTTATFELWFGETAGNQIQFTAPAFQIIPPIAPAERQGQAVYPLNFLLCRSSGDDSYQIVHQ